MIRSASTYALPIAIFHTPFVQVGITATSERGATSEARFKGLFAIPSPDALSQSLSRSHQLHR